MLENATRVPLHQDNFMVLFTDGRSMTAITTPINITLLQSNVSLAIKRLVRYVFSSREKQSLN